MLNPNSRPFGILCKILACTVANLSAPLLFADTARNLAGELAKPAAVTAVAKPSRLLTFNERNSKFGKDGQNPYVSGTRKWDVVFKGIDMLSGNYTANATDLSFDTGYGIPINVTRSYSSNCADEGPLGVGWSISVDVRSTAGGILKGPGAPVMSVPTNFKERPSAQLNDPNAPMGVQPVAAVVATDAGGTEETIQKDVDGILSTPPWDKNTIDSAYQTVLLAGTYYQVLSASTTTTLDGTVYSYSVHGFYPNGTQPYGGGAGGEASNVLKVDTATDRQGNVTQYSYTSGAGNQVQFAKYNGTTQEDKLTQISMPGGHVIYFTWGDGVSAPTNRIVTAADNGSRTVTYGYTGTLLTSVMTPAGYTTNYGYGSAITDGVYTGPVPYNLLMSITDPRGLQTKIEYLMTYTPLNPSTYGSAPFYGNMPTPVVYWEEDPNQVTTEILGNTWTSLTQNSVGSAWAPIYPPKYQVHSGGWSGPVLFTGQIQATLTTTTSPPTVTIQSNDFMGTPGTLLPNPQLQWIKTYDYWTEDLLQEVDYIYPWVAGDMHTARSMAQTNMNYETVETDNQWNFMGNPLSKSVIETIVSSGGTSTKPAVTTSYAYWDQSKYYQQKAIKDPAGRYQSYTDYFTNTAAVGWKGQRSFVYDPKNASFFLNTGVTPPLGTAPTDYWKYQLQPVSGTPYSGTFAFDSVGRCTDVWKLQTNTGVPAVQTYVQTHTLYGGVGAPTWGQAYQIVEDYGGINRTTTNNDYTPWGKPRKVTDGAGHIFWTDFDNDGNVKDVIREDVTPNVTLLTNSIGLPGSGVYAGVPSMVVDGLSGVIQQIFYSSTAGSSIGQVTSVQQSGGLSAGYTNTYTYTAAGDRATANYATADGSITWQYDDYEEVGTADNPKRVPQTLTKLSGTALTAEAMHYQYDSSGRLTGAAFAQTPYTGFTPSGSNPWYDAYHPAQSRARAFYAYDAGGRTLACEHYWDTLSGSSYGPSQTILANDCAYDPTLGLKTDSFFYAQTPGTPTTWTLSRHETYVYDPQLDYLTGANYNDGLANAMPSWSYDAAWNRTDSVCDNLNDTTMIGGVLAHCDILGNRTSLGSSSYTWDCLDRMTGYATSGTSCGYEYRADGMRTHKAVGSVATDYYHDAQMPVEDAVMSGSSITATRYGIGSRGIDYEEVATGTLSGGSRVLGSFSNVGFPIYDAHGNMIATLARYGTGTFSLSNQRSYDAWGAIRQGAGSGDPKNRHCASLGHQQDDESSLIYMRARYYDTSSGRFISQDQNLSGRNWFIYANDNPTSIGDPDGNESMSQLFLISLIQSMLQGVTAWVTAASTGGGFNKISMVAGLLAAMTAIITAFFDAIFGDISKPISLKQLKAKIALKSVSGIFSGAGIGFMTAMIMGKEAGQLESELLYIDYGT